MGVQKFIQELQDHRDENKVNKGVKLEKRVEFNSIEQMHNLELMLLEKFNKLEIQLIETKLEIFQWMCFFWITQMFVYIAIILILIK